MRRMVFILAGLATAAVVVTAQGQNARPADGTTEALVTELRALRADLNRIAGGSIRTQLLVGRLQLQEQRILTLSRQIADVQKEAAGVAQIRGALEGQIKGMERAAEDSPDEQERKAARQHAQQLQPQVAEHQQREQELRQQESSLSALLAEEQARWTDFSSRLDELERALTSRQ